jgi:Holliday junction DNA helicase RuvA
MIGRLTGKVVTQEGDGAVVVDVGGVGYEVTVPQGTLGQARVDDAGRVTLWVHTHVREDALSLFAFADETERAAFRILLGVSNVGPKSATAILGALPARELESAVARRDLAALTAIPGVGKKIAERLLLELRDKLPKSATARPAGSVAVAGRGVGDEESKLRSALTNMGFKPAEAERAMASLGERVRNAPMAETLREALALLSK